MLIGVIIGSTRLEVAYQKLSALERSIHEKGSKAWSEALRKTRIYLSLLLKSARVVLSPGSCSC